MGPVTRPSRALAGTSHEVLARYSHIRMESERKALESIVSKPAPAPQAPQPTEEQKPGAPARAISVQWGRSSRPHLTFLVKPFKLNNLIVHFRGYSASTVTGFCARGLLRVPW
jgi:hypothetical protein